MIDFTNYTKATLLAQALANIPAKFDKRDTSPIQTALGLAAEALAGFYLNLDLVQRSAFVQTATGDDLDQLAVIGGLTREAASPAVRLGIFDTAVPVGSRFSTVNGANSINFACSQSYTRSPSVSFDSDAWDAMALADGTYTFVYDDNLGWTLNGEAVVIAQYGITMAGSAIQGDTVVVEQADGSASETFTQSNYYTYELTAETAGTIGNDYAGSILPITVIPGLSYAYISDILVLGDDAETDDELRERLIEALNESAFAGNIQAYRQAALAIDGVGAVQVYPTWNGGGTVKLSILGSDLLPASSTTVDNVQTAIDPTVNQGAGLGTAPIGAIVTVDTAQSVAINISATVSLQSGFTLTQVVPLIKEAIENHLASLRAAWDAHLSDGVSYATIVYYARILTAILSVAGVLNVTNLTVNGGSSDITLTETGALQQVPELGTVTISE